MILELTESGLYCAGGDFYVDPWRPVERAVITHAHADHVCAGSRAYLAAAAGVGLLPEGSFQALEYGEPVSVGDVRVSLHPAGHMLGSAQVRLETGGEVWVVSGDYKLEADPTCAAFEAVKCHTFVTEATFGLPIYRWRPRREVIAEILEWRRANLRAGKASVLFAHDAGMAQRVWAELDVPIFPHEEIERTNGIYRAAGVVLAQAAAHPQGALILAPPSANGTPWLRQFDPVSTGLVSGWMRIRGTRRRRSLDRGFVLSNHADWPGLMAAIQSTGASHIWVTHGYRGPVVEWLKQQGFDALALETRFEGDLDETGS